MTAAQVCLPPPMRPSMPMRAGPVLAVVEPDRADDDLSLDELGSRIVGLAGRLAAATCRWLLLVAAFDGRAGYDRFGLPSTARWLSHACGISHRTAVEHVRVARALAVFPVLADELGCGRLSYSHVRAISRLARVGEQTVVADLVEFARNATITQLELVVRGLRTVEDDEGDGGRRPEQYLAHTWTGQSQWRVTARLDPEHGALVQSVLESVAGDERLPLAQALVRMAEIALAALADRDNPPRALRGDERAAIVVHVEESRLPPQPQPQQQEQEQERERERDAASSEEASRPRSAERGRPDPEPGRPVGRVADGPGLPDAVVLALMCLGRIRTVVQGRGDDGQRRGVLDLGRTHRVVTERLFRALVLRDGGCTHPGCRSRAGLEAHHVRHWLFGGVTRPDNLVLLCRRHHHGHHAGEFSIVLGVAGQFRFLRGDGRELEPVTDPTRLRATDLPLEDEHPDIAPDAATSAWSGERLDRPWAVAVLAQRRQPTTTNTVPVPEAKSWWDDSDPWNRTA